MDIEKLTTKLPSKADSEDAAVVIQSLKSLGMDKSVLRHKPFKPYKALTEFKSNARNIKQKTIGLRVQSDTLELLFEKPFVPRVTCISSFPSDLMAKQLASKLFHHAYMKMCAQHKDIRKKKELPVWHRVTGGYTNKFLDDYARKRPPAMVIISNVNMESTPSKIEKVRDILDTFQDSHRIIVTGGANPSELFVNKLFFNLDAALFLGPANRVGASSMLDM